MAHTKLLWVGPTQNTDNTAFTESQFCGYELMVDGGAPQSIIVAWDGDNNYEFEMASAQLQLAPGNHSVQLRVANKQAQRSEWTSAVTFTIAEPVHIPNPPALLTAA